MESLLLSCRALASPTMCRFYPGPLCHRVLSDGDMYPVAASLCRRISANKSYGLYNFWGGFVRAVVSELTMPNFDSTLLGLRGISSGTYAGFKLPEPPK
jgi:hypothetical protein